MKKFYACIIALGALIISTTLSYAFILIGRLDNKPIVQQTVVATSRYNIPVNNTKVIQETIKTKNIVKYRIRCEFGFLVIYTVDNILYDTTNISINQLPREEQINILNERCVLTESEMYSFLEAYSS